MKQKLKRIFACVLVLCMGFGVQSNLAFAQENDDTIAQENVADYTTDMTDDTDTTDDTTDDTTGATTDDTKDTDTNGEVDVNTKMKKNDENVGDSQHTKYGLTDEEEWKDCNKCSEDNPHLISTPADLDKIRTHTHTEGNVTSITGYFKLADDIIFNEEDFAQGGTFYNNGMGWLPLDDIGWEKTFTGSFDGDGYSIQGLISNVNAIQEGLDNRGIGLFSCLKGEVKNLTLKNFSLYKNENSTREEAGALSGYVNGATIENVNVINCEIYGSRCGGIVGYGISSSFKGCKVQNVTIHGKGNCGGIIGAVRGGVTVENCDVEVKIQDIAGAKINWQVYTGGIWGGQGFGDYSNKENKIKNVTVDFTYKSDNQGYVGGLIGGHHNNGSNTQVTIDSAIVNVKITAGSSTSVGGIFGQLNSHNFLGDSKVSNVVVTGTISADKQDDETVSAIGRCFSSVKLSKIYSNVTRTGQGVQLPAVISEKGKLNLTNCVFTGGETIISDYFAENYSYQQVERNQIKLVYGDKVTDWLTTRGTPEITDIFSSKSSDIIQLKDNVCLGVGAGNTEITAKTTIMNKEIEFCTISVTVKPLSIIYGPADKTNGDGRPYITYSLNKDGTTPTFSELLGFYPVKNGSQEGTYEANTDKPKITLNPSIANDGDVYYRYKNDVSGNIVETDTLPTHPTIDKNGSPHSIEVELILKSPNYRFVTIGTNWEPKESIKLYVTCYEEGLNMVDMYLEGDDTPLESFGDRYEYEYTGEGIIPTERNLTTLYTKGKNTTQTIKEFTAHFHAVTTNSGFAGTHLTKVKNTELTTDALKSIAPKELGVYSFVVNGYNKDTKTYCYASRRYSIVKGTPKGYPIFNFIEGGKTLSDVKLSGTMKNKIGKTVTGTFTWENGNQTVQAGTAYKWTFTPDDNVHYEVVSGQSIVCPIHQVIFDTNGGSKVNETNAEYNKEISEPETTREGYRFVGWYTNKECTKVFDFKTPITQDITLYAKWNGIPTINASDKTLTVGDTFDPLKDVTASDKEDGDITEKVEVLSNDVDTSKAGTYTVIYKVTDSKEASSTKTITVTVKAKDTQNPTTDDSKKPSATDTDKKPASTDKQTTSNSPKTGDSTNMTTWLALMFVSLGLLAGVFTVRKSRKSR